MDRFFSTFNTSRQVLNGEKQPKQRVRTSPSDHYYMAESSRMSESLTAWLAERRGDSAFDSFITRLQNHLLARMLGLEYSGDEHDFSDEDRLCINIKDNRIYFHSTVSVNYTTYDLRREQDCINPLRRSDIMVLSHEDEKNHPYWYARVIHVFHVLVQVRENIYSPFSQPTRMDVLFVRWFGRDVNYPSGWSEKRLHRLRFLEHDGSLDPFGFIDPDSVIRGVHIIPAFAHRSTDELLGPSKARRKSEEGAPDDEDWNYYYINMFVDRDMFMRFRGGGIGHKATWEWNDYLEGDTRAVDSASEDTTIARSDDEDGNNMEVEDSDEEDEEGEGEDDEQLNWEGVMERDGDSEIGDIEGDQEGDINDDDKDSNEGDDDLYGNEGYGAP